jgi:hypothetical protein
LPPYLRVALARFGYPETVDDEENVASVPLAKRGVFALEDTNDNDDGSAAPNNPFIDDEADEVEDSSCNKNGNNDEEMEMDNDNEGEEEDHDKDED